MRHIIIRDIVVDDHLSAEVMDDECYLSLADFAQACGQQHDWVMALVEHSILEVEGTQPELWRFDGWHLARARRVWRLQRDFDASISAVAVMIDLLDEVKQLRAQLVQLSQQR
jgi:chaperone modulatory protein CbpM